MYLPLRSACECSFSSRAKTIENRGAPTHLERFNVWFEVLQERQRGCSLCPVAAGAQRRSHKVSVCWRRRLPRGQQGGGGGPRGKALNFCQAQITTPFFTPWFFNWENHCVPQSYELHAHAMSQLGLRPDRIHCLFFCLFYCVVTIVVVFNCSDLFQDCTGRTTCQMYILYKYPIYWV